MAWTKIFILSAALLVGPSNAGGGLNRVFGGEGVDIKSFPYQASLRFLNSHTCGGSIISDRHILTAAHCINKYMRAPYTFVRVVTGTSYVNGGGQSHRIARIDVHPGWVSAGEKNRPHDIAIVTLKDQIAFDEYQRKINLPEHDCEKGVAANLTGWGQIKQVPPVRPTQLQMMETKLISLQECQDEMPEPAKTKIFDTQVCAFHSYGHGPCFGDSGGPLVVRDEVVGIVSYGDGNKCAAGIPDAYTNVYSYKNFIISTMNESNNSVASRQDSITPFL